MNRERFYTAVADYKDNSLQHHGILGQKWGIRRFQNPDGTLTAKGRARYTDGKGNFTKSGMKKYQKDTAKDRKVNKKFYDAKEKAIETGDVKFAYKHQKEFSDNDFKRIQRVINEKQKYSNLVNQANQMRMNKIRAYTDIMNLTMQTLNNTMGLANNVMNLSNRIEDIKKRGSQNSERFEASVFDSEGHLISKTNKYTDSSGVKRSDTYQYQKKK